MLGFGNYCGIGNPYSPYGMMGAMSGPVVPKEEAHIDTYTGREKNDTAVKILGFGSLAILAGALILKGNGKKFTEIFKKTKNVVEETKEKITNFTKKTN